MHASIIYSFNEPEDVPEPQDVSISKKDWLDSVLMYKRHNAAIGNSKDTDALYCAPPEPMG